MMIKFYQPVVRTMNERCSPMLILVLLQSSGDSHN